MGAFTVAMGVMMRATRVNACGKPIEGPGNRVVTKGYTKAVLTPVFKERQELEQTTADNTVCVNIPTPATLKHYKVDLSFCGVDPALYSMYTGYPVILDYAGKPIGYDDRPQVENAFGVVTEIWTAGRSNDDCPAPASDAELFSTTGTGQSFGYYIINASEFQPGPTNIAAAVTEFDISGISRTMPHWLRGPYNVAGIDAKGTPGRMLKPLPKDTHRRFFYTPVPPPAPTHGAAPLAIQSIFAGKYTGAGALAVAPEQPGATLTISAATLSVTAAAGAGQTKNLHVVDSTGVDRTAAATWTSSDPAKATVAGGVVTGKAAGTTKVSASYGGVTSGDCTVTVT